MSRLTGAQRDHLAKLEAEIADLGRQIEQKKNSMLEMLRGRRVHSRGSHFEVETATIRGSGMGGVRVYFSGHAITKSGGKHSRNTGLSLYQMMEKIE